MRAGQHKVLYEPFEAFLGSLRVLEIDYFRKQGFDSDAQRH